MPDPKQDHKQRVQEKIDLDPDQETKRKAMRPNRNQKVSKTARGKRLRSLNHERLQIFGKKLSSNTNFKRNFTKNKNLLFIK